MSTGRHTHAEIQPVAPRGVGAWSQRWDANRSIAPRISPFAGSSPVEKPSPIEKPSPVEKPRRLERRSRGRVWTSACPTPQTLVSAWNLMGCHGIRAGISGVKQVSAVPKAGSALHHLVTAVSVKKALTVAWRIAATFRGYYLPNRAGKAVMRPAHTRPKCEAAAHGPIALARPRRNSVGSPF